MIDAILNSFEIWVDAKGIKSRTRISGIENISLEGISQLRELILKLALMGKLVEQDGADEHARKLLDQVNTEKNNWIKKGKIKNEKSHLPLESNEKPYFLPVGWVWCRLADISILINGDRGKNYPSKEHYVEKGIPFITAANLGDRFLKYDSLNYISEDRFALLRSGQVEQNDILYCLRGSLGKCAIVDRISKGAIASSLCIIRLFPGINYKFLLNYFLSPLGREMINRHDNGTAQPNLSGTDVKKYVFPLPPIAEQQRIVVRVDDLMALCDKLEEQQFRNLKTHQILVKTFLESLTLAGDANELQAAWERTKLNFDVLFSTEDSIDQLKQTILQLAIMGKLVKQDPNDEPASELIRKIAKAKEELIEDGKIKRIARLAEISEDEKLFVLPEGWEWKRLNDVIDVRDGTHDSPKETFGDNTYPLITSQNFENGSINFDTAKRISNSDHLEISKRSLVEKYDILFSMIGGNLGNQVMVNTDKQFSVKNVALFKYYCKDCTSPFFIKKVMEYIALTLQSRAIGGAQPFVSLGYLRNIVIAMPPAAEQIRIVTKIGGLFNLCESLKEKVLKSQGIKVLISRTIVEKAVQ